MRRAARKGPKTKHCLNCGKEFEVVKSKYAQKYCSISCGGKKRHQDQKKKYPNGFFKDKTCKLCGKTFTPTNPCQLYCSPECRDRNSAYLRRNYNLNKDELASMKQSQNNRCYLCGSEGFLIGNNNHAERLVVDHCHETGRVRKLLCHNCNRALGLFKENVELLQKAIQYLIEFRQP